MKWEEKLLQLNKVKHKASEKSSQAQTEQAWQFRESKPHFWELANLIMSLHSVASKGINWAMGSQYIWSMYVCTFCAILSSNVSKQARFLEWCSPSASMPTLHKPYYVVKKINKFKLNRKWKRKRKVKFVFQFWSRSPKNKLKRIQLRWGTVWIVYIMHVDIVARSGDRNECLCEAFKSSPIRAIIPIFNLLFLFPKVPAVTPSTSKVLNFLWPGELKHPAVMAL